MISPLSGVNPHQADVSESLISHGPSLAPTGSFKKELVIFEILQPSLHHGIHLWSLFYLANAQRILLDLHGHQNGPLNGPCEADFGRRLVKKDSPGSLHDPN